MRGLCLGDLTGSEGCTDVGLRGSREGGHEGVRGQTWRRRSARGEQGLALGEEELEVRGAQSRKHISGGPGWLDLRVGGSYRYVFVTDDGTRMVFHGTYLEVEAPTRTVETWLYDGWPNADALETMDLREADGVTTLTLMLAFSSQAGRDNMTKYDGLLESLDRVEEVLVGLNA